MVISADMLWKGVGVVINPQSDRSRSLLIEGIVDEILTGSNTHPHGILVRLESGEKGRVKSLIETSSGSENLSTARPVLDEVTSHKEIVIPPWLHSENPYLVRDIAALKLILDKEHKKDVWRDHYYEDGICGCLQEMTKLIESKVEEIFKQPIFLISESNDISELLYGRSSPIIPPTYRFASSTDLLHKLQFVFNDSRKKERLIDLANYIDSDIGLLFEKIGTLDRAAIPSLNAIRNYRNHLSHPSNDVLSQSKSRFIVDYALVDFEEIYALDVYLR